MVEITLIHHKPGTKHEVKIEGKIIHCSAQGDTGIAEMLFDIEQAVNRLGDLSIRMHIFYYPESE